MWGHQRKQFKFLLFITGVFFLLYCLHIIERKIPRNMKNKDGNPYPEKSNDYLKEQLQIDRSPPPYSEIIRAAQEATPSFPILFWEDNKHKPLYYKNRSCAPFPNVYRMPVNNIYWQILTTKSRTNVYLYNAYYDMRERCSICPAVRLLAMVDKHRVNLKTYCQIWFADSMEPAFAETLEDDQIRFIRDEEAPLWPYLITCPIPKPFVGRIPIIVSLVENMCDTASNGLRVIFNKRNQSEEKKDFAVCVKNSAFSYKDLSARLVEWIEMVNLLGAKKIVFYILHVHDNVTKVLEHYKKQGLVEIIHTTIAGNQANDRHLQHLYFKAHNDAWYKTFGNENLQMNDCLYKNMYNYDFIIPLDIDEVIIPHEEHDWASLIKSIVKKLSLDPHTIYNYYNYMTMFPHCSNVSLFDDIPSYMYMLQHIISERRDIYIDTTAKSFCNTELARKVNNHAVLGIIHNDFSDSIRVGRKEAELFHYRAVAYSKKEWPCEEFISNPTIDKRLWLYKEPLINRTLTTLYNLGFYN